MKNQIEAQNILSEIVHSRGILANIHEAYADYPVGVAAHFDFYGSVVLSEGGPLPRYVRELIGVQVSELNRCNYCVQHHKAALEINCSVMIDESIRDYFQKFSSCITHAPEKLADLRERFPFQSTVGAWEHAIYIGAYFNMVNRMAHAAGISLEDNFHLSCH